jgi:hypothetical protein
MTLDAAAPLNLAWLHDVSWREQDAEGEQASGGATAEAYFTMLAVREPYLARQDDLRVAARRVYDWDEVVTTAVRHGVAAFLRQAIAQAGISIPHIAADMLRNEIVDATARVALLNAELVQVVDVLAAAAIPVIVLKGPALARTIYPAAALRPYRDIDIVVENMRDAAAALVASGLSELSDGMVEQGEHADQCRGGCLSEQSYLTESGRAVVELHPDPLLLGLPALCEAERWERATPVPQLDGALMLCPEDQLVHLSVHAHKHGFSRLIWVKDLDLLLRTHRRSLDWRLVVSSARLEGVRASVWYSLHLARTLLRTPVPPQVLARLRPAPLVRALYRALWPISRIANMAGRMRGNAVQFNPGASQRGMLPSLVLMGRRRERARGLAYSLLGF